jgi:hypothetical protein
MRCSLGVPIFLVLSCLPLHAQEQPNSPRRWLEVGQAIVCDTPEQVERFVALRGDGRDVAVAMQTVNDESQDSSACNVALVAFTERRLIAEPVIQGKLASIVQIMVHAFGNGTTWRTIAAHAQYTIEVKEGQIISDAKRGNLAQPSQPLGITARQMDT